MQAYKSRKSYPICLALLLILSTFSLAQSDEISPQSIIIDPSPPSSYYQVSVFVDRDPSGESNPKYDIGEDIRIGVQPTEASYIYLFNIRSNGIVTQILPNRLDSYGADNFVHAGHTRYFPDHNSSYRFAVDGPEGLEKIIAVASKQPLDTHSLANFTHEGSFATSSIGESGFASTLSIIVQPLPEETWVTDTAVFYVVRPYVVNPPAPPPPVYPPSPPPVYPPPVAHYGVLEINSHPAGAAIYVDGQFVNYTPSSFSTSVGSHSVRLELSGYTLFDTTVNLHANETYTINATLQTNSYRSYSNYEVPTNKKDCKKGGWQNLRRHDGTAFNNQGQCISYVNNSYGHNYNYENDDEDDD